MKTPCPVSFVHIFPATAFIYDLKPLDWGTHAHIKLHVFKISVFQTTFSQTNSSLVILLLTSKRNFQRNKPKFYIKTFYKLNTWNEDILDNFLKTSEFFFKILIFYKKSYKNWIFQSVARLQKRLQCVVSVLDVLSRRRAVPSAHVKLERFASKKKPSMTIVTTRQPKLGLTRSRLIVLSLGSPFPGRPTQIQAPCPRHTGTERDQTALNVTRA